MDELFTEADADADITERLRLLREMRLDIHTQMEVVAQKLELDIAALHAHWASEYPGQPDPWLAYIKKNRREHPMKNLIELQQRRWRAAEGKAPLPEEHAKGLIVVFTGSGKGKSSAAFGMAWRAIHNQKKVGVVQFLGGSRLGAEYALLTRHARCDFRIFGGDFSAASKTHSMNASIVNAAWGQAQAMLQDPSLDMLIFDDINPLIHAQYLNMSGIRQHLLARPGGMHVVLTGSKAPFELTDMADIVTEMRAIKHPYPAVPIAAQAGVEF